MCYFTEFKGCDIIESLFFWEDVVVSGNTATKGGGIYRGAFRGARLTDFRIENNT